MLAPEVVGGYFFVGGGDGGGDFVAGGIAAEEDVAAEGVVGGGGDAEGVADDGEAGEVDVDFTAVAGDVGGARVGEGGAGAFVGDDLDGVAVVEEAAPGGELEVGEVGDVEDVAGVTGDVGGEDVVEVDEVVGEGAVHAGAPCLGEGVVEVTEGLLGVGAVVAVGVVEVDDGFFDGGGGVATGDAVLEVAFVVVGTGNVVAGDVGNDVLEHFLEDEGFGGDTDVGDAVGDGGEGDDDGVHVAEFVEFVFPGGVTDRGDAHDVGGVEARDVEFELAVDVGGSPCHGAEETEVGEGDGLAGGVVNDDAFYAYFAVVLRIDG